MSDDTLDERETAMLDAAQAKLREAILAYDAVLQEIGWTEKRSADETLTHGLVVASWLKLGDGNYHNDSTQPMHYYLSPMPLWQARGLVETFMLVSEHRLVFGDDHE